MNSKRFAATLILVLVASATLWFFNARPQGTEFSAAANVDTRQNNLPESEPVASSSKPAQQAMTDEACLEAYHRALKNDSHAVFSQFDEMAKSLKLGNVADQMDEIYASAAKTQSEIRAKLEFVSHALKDSPDPRHMFFRGLAAYELERRFELFYDAIQSNPNDVTMLYGAMSQCAHLTGRKRSQCPTQRWREDLLAVDSDNGFSWMLVASDYYNSGDHDQALSALQNVLAAPALRDYNADILITGERALAAVGGMAFEERVRLSKSAALRSLFNAGGVTDMCVRKASVDPAWAQACAGFGELMRAQDRGNESGVYKAEVAGLQALGDSAGLERLEAIRATTHAKPESIGWRELLKRVRPKPFPVASQKLVASDPRVWAQYQKIRSASGPAEASGYVLGEVLKVFADKVPLECRDRSTQIMQLLDT
ncbi:MAG: hypothetical protein AB8G18_02830 [Gammaproteobacteria bacterium]